MPSGYQNPYESMSQEEMLAKIMAEGQGEGGGRPLTLPGIGVRGPDVNASTIPEMPEVAPGPRGEPVPGKNNPAENYILTHPGVKTDIGAEGRTGAGPAARALRRHKEQLEQQRKDLGF